VTQAYFDPKRARDPHALPDCEVYYSDTADLIGGNPAGWYWQACFPGCLPDGDPVGPFDTEADALADAQSGMEE
jgi:hypothetical protein